MNHHDLVRLELEAIQKLHADAAAKLKSALLDGAPWESVQDIRHHLTELEIALHQKRHSGSGSETVAPGGKPAYE